ncbi:MAG: TonB-dependent receptor [Bacteroidota bacterium]
MGKYIGVLLLFYGVMAFAQTPISGRVMDGHNNPIPGANVYLEGTYDGSSTDNKGFFQFTTSERGIQTLLVSMISYESAIQTGDVRYFNDLKLVLREAINQLTGVTLTAGTFAAGDNSKASVLKPLDVVTTAGAVGDFIGALQTLPGTATVNEDGRLFVRGGTANETQTFIDGMRVFQPFSATANNIPTRSRFSPFLFKGITFSTGGYSAEYGQALSSVLLLNTTDIPDQERTDIGIMTVGGNLGHTKIWDDESLSLNTSYINLAPYQELIPDNQGVRWNTPYSSIAGEAVFRSKGENGFFKCYTGFNHASLDVDQEDINFEEFVRFHLANNNLYLNTNYKHFFDRGWTLYGGASVSHDTNDITLLDNTITTRETASHLKIKLGKNWNSRFKLSLGSEYFFTDYEDRFTDPANLQLESGFTDHLVATFSEVDIFFSNRFALQLGVRAEYSGVLEAHNLAPRASLAYTTGDKGQISVAYGDFYQNPLGQYLRFSSELSVERTSHYILNYQVSGDGTTFRAELFYKDYDNLVKFDTPEVMFNSNFTNGGKGYARGVDVFWRDNTSLANLDYWISYSFLDTERDFQNFPERATPNFASNHNFSVVTKYWMDKLKSQLGVSYTYASGRPYDNPNTAEFLAGRTKAFNSLSLNWSYLIDSQKILFFSVSNALGFNNINGYQYADRPNMNGIFDRRAIRAPADTFFLVGFFWTISRDKKTNQLDNL